MDQRKILFLDVEKSDEEIIKKSYPKANIENRQLNKNILKKYKNVEILCVFIYTSISEEIINNLPNLKLIVTRSVGFDHIDLVAAKNKGIKICNVPDYGSHVIAEHVFALLLSSLRHIREGEERVENNEFNFQGLRGIALKGKTMGVIGTGRIGRNVARIASLGFLMHVIAYDIYPDEDYALENHFQYTNIDEIWEKSDIISFHIPLLNSTKDLVNKKTIAKMKDGVALVNTARGGIINTKDLISGINSGKISYAMLDVLEHEKNIKEDRKLIDLPQVVTTPHIAFYADDSMKKMYSESFASIDEYIKGKELKRIVSGI